MVKVVGIRFRNAGKIYYFGPVKLQLNKNCTKKGGITSVIPP